MKCSAFIAMSVDGYIATVDGGVDWLEEAGNSEVGDRPTVGDGGFADYLASVDCMVMGRHCLEKIASFELTAEQWPYGDIPIFALSRTLTQVPDALPGKVEIYSGEIPDLISSLESESFTHAYVDGGATITSFLRLGLLNEICVTQVPLILGDGLPLFGQIGKRIRLSEAESTTYSNDFIQWKYRVG